ncbi:site-specific recombinase [Edwardsiella piscicida]|uniref:Uncharacterized protein n=2 Tax=Edwardsiella TaxID=635 RepID=A0A0H3DV48_EDWTF|nr:site-specific recombinase [Edwardsiella tarda EIB202]ADM41814.1 hypothetical protein ETAF_1706 [Edwardsiella tarda FL6-60]ARD19797.1 recombinase [Edwardsiella piscicida]QBB13938.1 recombinase [Edwardsiella piscicida]
MSAQVLPAAKSVSHRITFSKGGKIRIAPVSDKAIREINTKNSGILFIV